MLIYRTKDLKKIIRLSHRDITILMMINLGANSATDIAGVLGITKQAVSSKVEKMCVLGFTRSVSTNQQSQKREYTITPQGVEWLNKVLTNASILIVD